MPTPRALIVDDSRTAQHRLKKLLARYELEVDMAASAEEALGYLTYCMPSVIFMDHHMEGMDGFEALRIIKANPSTAMIPVIMYTAKSDDVYAGQAHALGALDTLSKSLMRPSRVEEVLAKLHVYPKGGEDDSQYSAAQNDIIDNTGIDDTNFDGSSIDNTNGATEDTAAQEEPAIDNPEHFIDEEYTEERQYTENLEDQPSTLQTGEFKAQIARLFELHIADVRTQISENTKYIVERLENDIKASANTEARVDDVPLSIISEQTREQTSKLGMVSNAMLSLILVALVAISFQLYESQQQIHALKENYLSLSDLDQQKILLLDELLNQPQNSISVTPSTLDIRSLLNTISWTTGIDTHFRFDQQPLNEQQVLNLQNLTYRLYSAGFRGLVELDIHLGNFCVIQKDTGEWSLPEANTPMSECELLDTQKIDLDTRSYTSLAYLQFEQTAPPIQRGDIEFLLTVSGFENPLFEYPTITPDLTAEKWNSVARANQYVAFNIDTQEIAAQ